MLRPRDKELVREIIDYAQCFGTREPVSHELALSLGGEPGRVVHTMDDAMLLRADDDAREWVSTLNLPQRYVVASFAGHSGTSGIPVNEYFTKAAKLLDRLALRLDADIALAPHAGSLDSSQRGIDQLGNDAILAASTSGRLHALDMLTVRQDVALTEGAILSLSTRYHPTVFGPRAATPTASISISYYSSARMRGAMGNVGLRDFVVPSTAWDLAEDASVELVERTDEYRQALAPVIAQREAEQAAWWDAIVRTANGDSWIPVPDLAPVASFSARGAWSAEVEHVTGVFDLFGREKIWSKWFWQDAKELRKQLKDQTERLSSLQAELSGKHQRPKPAFRRIARGAARRVKSIFRRS